MIIERLRVSRFRGLGTLELRLGPGLTVIRGPDESGRSSIVAALVTALFGRVTSAETIREHRSWAGGEPFALELTFRAGDEHLELVRDFAHRSQSLRELGTAQLWTETRAIDRRLTGLLGCPSQAFFESTACVRQGCLALIDGDRAALAERLRRTIALADQGAADRQALAERRDALARELRLVEQAIEDLARERGSVAARLAIAAEARDASEASSVASATEQMAADPPATSPRSTRRTDVTDPPDPVGTDAPEPVATAAADPPSRAEPRASSADPSGHAGSVPANASDRGVAGETTDRATSGPAAMLLPLAVLLAMAGLLTAALVNWVGMILVVLGLIALIAHWLTPRVSGRRRPTLSAQAPPPLPGSDEPGAQAQAPSAVARVDAPEAATPPASARADDGVTVAGPTSRDTPPAASAQAERVELLDPPRELEDSASERTLQALDDQLLVARRRQHQLADDLRRAEATLAAAAPPASGRTTIVAVVGGRIAAHLSALGVAGVEGVQLDPETLTLSIQRRDRPRPLVPEELSASTRDALYLSTRLALVEHAGDAGAAPVVLDDALASFDDVRAARAVDLLRAHAARGGQVFLLTATDRHDEGADRVVTLP